MSRFDERMNRGLVPLYDRLGDAATFHDAGSGQTDCRIIIDRDLSNYGDTIDLAIGTAVIAVRRSEFAQSPRRGEYFTVTETGEQLNVHSLVSRDDYEHRVLVTT